ncbi:MAG: hypothetical protein JSW61_06400 [Candidatus Thorarchaeota archaeon]|nr:MAG: hypothetical protein JSW61_06400 [Candidatus Thorarchaeota archaeon]
MSKVSRGVPKEIAEFGERQFNDTGAALVEILRVKAATVRKHFKQLQGATFLVSVASMDRVRIYFFDRAGNMMIAENIEPENYNRVRKQSRLLAKFVKPRPPTPEELRMEATEELRQALSKAIRRVSRALAVSEPEFPPTFVTKSVNQEQTQGFGVSFEEDGAILFEEPSVKSIWSEGIMTRTAFLLLLDWKKSELSFSECVGNALALSLARKSARNDWLQIWTEKSKNSEMKPVVDHFVNHSDTYHTDGYRWILQLIQRGPVSDHLEHWIKGLTIIHENLEVSLGTEDYHTIARLISSLSDPRKISKAQDKLRTIHLSARALCDPTPLGLELVIEDKKDADPDSDWLAVTYLEGGNVRRIHIGTGTGDPVYLVSYFLSIDNIFPKPGGIKPLGNDIIRWALKAFGLESELTPTYSSMVELKSRTLSSAEKAVLERLIEGEQQVLYDTLVGSPGRLKSLMDSGAVSMVPSFHHVGLKPNLLVKGGFDRLRAVAEDASLEATTFVSNDEAISLISAPGAWAQRAIRATLSNGCAVYPVVDILSQRGLIRTERMTIGDFVPS